MSVFSRTFNFCWHKICLAWLTVYNNLGFLHTTFIQGSNEQHSYGEDPGGSNVVVEDPENSHGEVEDPEDNHGEVEDPEDSHGEVEDPEDSHGEVEDPENKLDDAEYNQRIAMARWRIQSIAMVR